MQKRSFTKEFKLEVVQELSTGKPVGEVSREHDLKPTLVSRWRREHQQNAGLAFSGKGRPSREDTKVAQLERKIGQQAMEIDFVKKVNAGLQAMVDEQKKTRRLP